MNILRNWLAGGVSVFVLNACIQVDTGSTTAEQDDRLAPVISSTTVKEISEDTSSIQLSVSTNELALCKYDDVENVEFTRMENIFASTNSTNHAVLIEGLDNSLEQNVFYIRCQDSVGNVNNADMVVSVAYLEHEEPTAPDQEDLTPPLLSGGSPNTAQIAGTTGAILELKTNEPAICKYSDVANTSYADMPVTMAGVNGFQHSSSILNLVDNSSYTYYVRCADVKLNENSEDYIIHFAVAGEEKEIITVDESSPVISAGLPAGMLSEGTSSVLMSVSTDEEASCKYSVTEDVVFGSMEYSFSGAGTNSHSVNLEGLVDGETYHYYVRCEDLSGNENGSDYLVNFEVALPSDVTAPVISSATPATPLAAGTLDAIISINTDEDANCKLSSNAGSDFETMNQAFDITGSTIHSTTVSVVDGESYTYYVRCSDLSHNVNVSDYPINIEVLHAVADGTPWSYPAIPYTDWAYNPFTIEMKTPVEWPSTAAQNYYYVEPDHPNATNSTQAGELTGDFGRFGYPDRPRSSIPTRGWIGDVFTAGTVIWLKGGTYTASNFRGGWSPQFHGTEDAPVWLYGDPSNKPTFTGPVIQMYNSSHVIFDNLQWIGGNTRNTVISLTRDRAGSTHHVTLRNLRFENLAYIGGGGAVIGASSSLSDGAVLHDFVAYNNVFKNNGGGYDWSTNDNDHHGFKINGIVDGNAAYRIWIIDNKAYAGDAPDSIDGLYKSLSGNLVQVGDQVASSGNNHHVYVAGNYQEYGRQALGWTKKSHDVIFSSNYCTKTHNLAGGNGQCYGHQYDSSDFNWWINNVGTESAAGWMHTGNSPMTGSLFIIGNIFTGNRLNEAADNWRSCSGATLFSQHGIHYFVNNVFDSSCHGIWALTNRHTATDQLHIYNNIFSNISGTIDTTSKALSLETSNGMQHFVENNLFDAFSNDVQINSTQYATVDDVNNLSNASGNIVGVPGYVDQPNENFAVGADSPAVDAGTQTYNSGAADVYQQFIDRYTNDPNYPGDPMNYWPKDHLKQNRVQGGGIDIGPHEQ